MVTLKIMTCQIYTKDLHHTNQEAHNQNENKSLFPIIHYTILYAGGKNF